MSFTQNKKKLILVLNSSQFYLLHRRNYALFLKEKGFEVHAILPKDEYFNKLNQEEVNFIPTNIHRKSLNPFLRLLEIWNLIKIYKKIRPDLIHHVTVVTIFLGSIAAFFARQKNIFHTFSGLGFIFEGKGFLQKIIRFFVVRILRILFFYLNPFCFTENQSDLELLIELKLLKKERSLVLPGAGIDLQRFSYFPENESTCRILLPARMIYDKGINEFQMAAKLLKPKYPHVEFLLAGRIDNGNPHAVSESTLTSWMKEGHVFWLGEVEDMVSLYRTVNIVCLPSYREGLPVSLLEACAVGRVVVTTDVPGCRDVVLGKNGILVPPKNFKELAFALETLILNPKLRIEMGREARRIAEQFFDEKKVFNMIYEQILKSKIF